jgi:hypothetical protein
MYLLTFLESNESKQSPSKFYNHLKCFSFYLVQGGLFKITSYSIYALAYPSLIFNHQLSTWFSRKVLSTMMIPTTEEMNILVINIRDLKLQTPPLWLLQYLVVLMGKELS